MKIYIAKLYHLFPYLGYSHYDLINLVENARENQYSDAYHVRNYIDEFHIVDFTELADGPVAYTRCNSLKVAQQRLKDVLCPLAKVGITDKVDIKLLSKMLDTNTKLASVVLTNKLNQ